MSRMPHCSAIVSSAVNLQKSALVTWESRPVGGLPMAAEVTIVKENMKDAHE